MFERSRRLVAVSLALGFVLSAAVGVVLYATPVGLPARPAQAAGSRAVLPDAIATATTAAAYANMPGPPPPVLIPPGPTTYSPATAGTTVRATDGRPVAQLATVPSSLSQSVATAFLTSQPPDPAIIAYQMLSVVRYEGQAQTVYVSTARPTAAALASNTALGENPVRLPDGSVAWSMIGMPGTGQYQVRWLSNGLVVSVIGNETVAQLEALAAQVVVR